MMQSMWRGVALLLLAAAATAAAAQGERAAGSAAPPVTTQLVEQKEALVNRLLEDSPAAQRIAASGNAQAQQFMSAGREHHRSALAALQAQDIRAADGRLNEALWSIGRARQLVPDSMYRVIEYRVRYAQLVASIESLQASYRGHLSHLGRAPDDDASWKTVAGLVEEAKSFRVSERLADANRLLLKAERSLLAAFGTVLGTNTLDYTMHFATAAEEFKFELDRYRSFGELVPLAIAELRPAGDALRLIDRYVESGRAARESAQQHAAQREYAAALKIIRGGTAQLERALTAAGLAAPQEAASP